MDEKYTAAAHAEIKEERKREVERKKKEEPYSQARVLLLLLLLRNLCCTRVLHASLSLSFSPPLRRCSLAQHFTQRLHYLYTLFIPRDKVSSAERERSFRRVRLDPKKSRRKSDARSLAGRCLEFRSSLCLPPSLFAFSFFSFSLLLFSVARTWPPPWIRSPGVQPVRLPKGLDRPIAIIHREREREREKKLSDTPRTRNETRRNARTSATRTYGVINSAAALLFRSAMHARPFERERGRERKAKIKEIARERVQGPRKLIYAHELAREWPFFPRVLYTRAYMQREGERCHNIGRPIRRYAFVARTTSTRRGCRQTLSASLSLFLSESFRCAARFVFRRQARHT